MEGEIAIKMGWLAFPTSDPFWDLGQLPLALLWLNLIVSGSSGDLTRSEHHGIPHASGVTLASLRANLVTLFFVFRAA